MSGVELPALDYGEWKETYETLHRWLQIAGKIKRSHEKWVNHSWSSTLQLTATGIGTGAVPFNGGAFSLDFDFFDHQLVLQSSLGRKLIIPLQSEAVALFYKRVFRALGDLGVTGKVSDIPDELPDIIPFSDDLLHHTYNPPQAQACWRTLLFANNVLKEFRADFVGKCSPVHLFWGSFDLAVTRFSGRRAPKHPGGVPHLSDRITREAYSHEVSSAGFWPGNDIYPYAAFYSYAYPEPEGFAQALIRPSAAAYHQALHEFILPYEAVRESPDPKKMILEFLNDTYSAAAGYGLWDREMLEHSEYLTECQRHYGGTT